MRRLTKPIEIEEIENSIDLPRTINSILSQNHPIGVADLNKIKYYWLSELTNYHYEMEQNKHLQHNNRVDFSKFKAPLKWLYENPSLKRQTAFINKIRNAYVENGILCPYCGVSPCRTLDHYYNKALLPQFSFLPENLIPCCGDCNKDKGSKKAFSKWKRIINPYYDDYNYLIHQEPLILVIFKENPHHNIDMSYIVTPNNKLEKEIRSQINYHLKSIKIGVLHQEMICNSFWRNAKQLRTYNTMLLSGDISKKIHTNLVKSFIEINTSLNYDWEYIIRYSLVNIKHNDWIYKSPLEKLQ
ncbi:TPA: hypothetical protein U5E00_002589 [Yersinia enterocolitica]|nr:hypothetical protein [Yersinia enterocolitica]EKN5061712.1 hypothetical protein [Yersinia enterocolitica]EKN6006380.1 hypothetical protein [Yersinia enterocolitica]ELI8277115.1 hypothetical protein [Yersinia enterocolitica]EMA9488946.1 hypothetical protein [Yersinia enterocolitica]